MGIHTDTELGVVVELYKITRPDQTKYFTSGDADLVYGGSTYRRASIKRSSIDSVFAAERQQLTIDASLDDVFSFLQGEDPSSLAEITVTRYNADSGDTQHIFAGYMTTYSLRARMVSVVFQSTGFRLDEEIPKIRLATTCSLALYGPHCGLAKNDWRVTCKATAVDYSEGSYVITAVAWGPNNFGEKLTDVADDDWAYSVIEFNAQNRLVSSVTSDGDSRLLNLIVPFADGTLKVGSIFYLYPGCNRIKETCKNRFNNYDNFVGFPTIFTDKEGEAIPLAYGTVTVRPTRIFTDKRSGGVPVGQAFVYYWNFQAAVCFGPVTWLRLYGAGTPTPDLAVPKAYFDLTDPTEAAMVFTGSNDGSEETHPTVALNPYSDPLINRYMWFTNLRGIAHFWSYYPQVNNVLLPDQWPEDGCFITVKRSLSESPVTPSWITGTYEGASPAAAIYDILTNTLYGLGIEAADLTLSTFDTASAYCQTKSYALNKAWSKAVSARKIVDEICATFGLRLVVDNAGKIGLVADNATATITPVATLTESEIVDLSLQRDSYESIINRVVAKVSLEYSDEVAKTTINDQASQMMLGRIQQKEYDLTGFLSGNSAASRAYEILKDNSYPKLRGTAQISLRLDSILPGQTIRITHADYGLNGLFRVLQRDYPDNDSDVITLEIEQLSQAVYDDSYEVATDDSLRSGTNTYRYAAGEELLFPAYSDTSATSVREYVDLTLVDVYIDNGENVLILLDAADYTINDEGGGLLSVTLASTWASSVQANSLGNLYVSVNERLYSAT